MRSQKEEPGGATWTHEEPGGARKSQEEEPGVARGSHEKPNGFLGTQNQKEGQEDQGTLKQLGGVSPLALSPFPGPIGLPAGFGLHGNQSSYPYLEV